MAKSLDCMVHARLTTHERDAQKQLAINQEMATYTARDDKRNPVEYPGVEYFHPRRFCKPPAQKPAKFSLFPRY